MTAWAMLRAFSVITFLQLCLADVGKWDVFSTKTTYGWAHAVPEPEVDEGYEILDGNATCQAAQVYLVSRHGSRWPSDGSMEVIEQLLTSLRENVDGPFYQDVLNYQSNYTLDVAGELAPLGEQEQYNLGRRTLTRFSSLFENNGQYIKFVSSTRSRNTASSIAFYEGFNSTDIEVGEFEHTVNGTLTHYYDDCKNYEDFVEDNDTHMAEFLDYENVQEFVNVKNNLSRSLGIKDLSADDMYVIFELCSYDKYLYKTYSFWCDLLTDEERLVLEYGQDLEAYYAESYTHPIIPEVTCPLIQDIFVTMDLAMNATWDYENLPENAKDQGYLAGKFLDGHSTTMITLYTTLGLFHDEQSLMANNREDMLDRQFQTSTITPYSANVVFVLYACADDDDDNDNTFKVQLQVNEEATLIPGCDEMLCPYEEFKKMYSSLIDNCDLDQICNGPYP